MAVPWETTFSRAQPEWVTEVTMTGQVHQGPPWEHDSHRRRWLEWAGMTGKDLLWISKCLAWLLSQCILFIKQHNTENLKENECVTLVLGTVCVTAAASPCPSISFPMRNAYKKLRNGKHNSFWIILQIQSHVWSAALRDTHKYSPESRALLPQPHGLSICLFASYNSAQIGELRDQMKLFYTSRNPTTLFTPCMCYYHSYKAKLSCLWHTVARDHLLLCSGKWHSKLVLSSSNPFFPSEIPLNARWAWWY